MKTLSRSTLLLGLCLSLPAFASGSKLYKSLINAAEKSPKSRINIFTKSYSFNPKALQDVSVGMDGVWTRHVELKTMNGSVKLTLKDDTADLNFQSFRSNNILNVTAYEEVEVTRIVEGRSWAPEFGAAVIPDANSRTGWSNALYPAPRQGRVVYHRVTGVENRAYQTDGYFLSEIADDKKLKISIAHDEMREVVVPGSTEWVIGRGMVSDWMKKMVPVRNFTTELNVKSGRVVYSEIQQTSPETAMIMVVTDTGAPRLQGEVYSMRFTDNNIQVSSKPIKGSLVSIERSTLGLDLPTRTSSRNSRSRRVIEE